MFQDTQGVVLCCTSPRRLTQGPTSVTIRTPAGLTGYKEMGEQPY